MIQENFLTVYGPVTSWRYGRSLGIDPIGQISTCSFNCVYCQLGEIERLTLERQVFIPTQHILEDFQTFDPWDVDVITFSGSGEPTLALNLGEIIEEIRSLTSIPLIVLTNGTLLNDPEVRKALNLCQTVSVKLDALCSEDLRRINRPINLNWTEIELGIKQFRGEYSGTLSIQTMILQDWDEKKITQYITLMQSLKPDEIQLNIPSRPKPLKRQLDGRGNHSQGEQRPYEVTHLKCISLERLEKIAQQLQNSLSIPIKYPKVTAKT